MTRVMGITDLHCGHVVGLTPPDWDKRPGEAYGTRAYAFWQHRRQNYKIFSYWCRQIQPDVVIANADLIDGKGKRTGGTEQLTMDRNEQCTMAVACLKETGAKRFVLSFGTSFHTGDDEDWEDRVAADLKAEKIGGEDNVNIHGVIINYRHHVSRSSIPHGRGTPLAKERLWNLLWYERGEYPKADIILRGHNHYFAYIGGADWLAISMPGLQGYGTKYGTRRVSGTIDFGVIWFDINEDGTWGWDKAIKRFNHKRNFALVI